MLLFIPKFFGSLSSRFYFNTSHVTVYQRQLLEARTWKWTTKQNAIKCLKRVSTPGLRKYTGYKDMPRVINGLGIAILSTSKGVMTDKEAADLKIGGEVLCYIY